MNDRIPLQVTAAPSALSFPGLKAEACRASGQGGISRHPPPAISETIRAVVQIADLVVVPTKPSPHDLRAVVGTMELVDEYNKPVVFVINAAVVRAQLTGQVAVALSQYGTVVPVTVHHRVAFSASMIDGRVARELNGKSRSAIAAPCAG